MAERRSPAEIRAEIDAERRALEATLKTLGDDALQAAKLAAVVLVGIVGLLVLRRIVRRGR